MHGGIKTFHRHKGGFTILELLLVISIVSILAASGVGYYRNTVHRVGVSTAGKIFIADTQTMHSKAKVGEAGRRWGVHVVNDPLVGQYYQLFSTPTTYTDPLMEIIATTTLPGGVSFSDPLPGMSKDILFKSITGQTTSTTVVMFSETDVATTTVTSMGLVY